MKCLVTGATGFVGSHLVQWLVQQNCQVAVLVRHNSNLWRLQEVVPNLHIIHGDLFSLEQSADQIRQFAPEIVFHLGWVAVGNKRRDDLAQLQNLNGSLNLLQIAHESGCQCWVGMGSQEEYGSLSGVITENLCEHPMTLYGISKLCTMRLTEKLCALYNIRFIWTRLFAAYGPMGNPDFLVPYVIRSLLSKTKPSLTTGTQKWDYMYVQDAVEAFWQLAQTPDANGIFNVGSGQVHSIREIVECIRDLINPELPLGFGEIGFHQGQPMHWQADISKLEKISGWTPHTGLEQGLTKTIDWYRMHEIVG
jgi:nucleoside-diphosphate-sugar epimerase